MDVPHSKTILSRALEEVTHESFERHLRTDLSPTIGRRALSTFYLLTGGRSNIRKAARIGGIWATNTLIIDSLLDGHGCQQIEHREKFLSNYLVSLQYGREPNIIEKNIEKAAYQAGIHTHNVFNRDASLFGQIVHITSNIIDMVSEEELHTPNGYKMYTEATGGLQFELCAVSLQLLDNYTLQDKEQEFAHDLGYLLQVTDDLIDEDNSLPNKKVLKEYREAVNRVREHEYKVINMITRIPPQIGIPIARYWEQAEEYFIKRSDKGRRQYLSL